MTDEIEIAREGAVLSAAFARPAKKNAITSAMYEALIDVLESADEDVDVGALVISGKGGAFTAGNDIREFLAIAAGAAGSRDPRDFPGWRFIARLADFGKPLVAAVQGPAVGIGTTLCFHCDLVYATADARFHMPFVNLGLVPEAGSSLLAPQRFGWAKAAEYLLLAEPFDAETACALGLVNAVVPTSELVAHAMGKAAALAAKPRSALIATRRLMRGDSAVLKERMAREIEAFGAALCRRKRVRPSWLSCPAQEASRQRQRICGVFLNLCRRQSSDGAVKKYVVKLSAEERKRGELAVCRRKSDVRAGLERMLV